MILEHVQKPFGGFPEMENRFEGLHINAKWILDFKGDKAILRCTAENRHDKRSIPVILKIQSFVLNMSGRIPVLLWFPVGLKSMTKL